MNGKIEFLENEPDEITVEFEIPTKIIDSSMKNKTILIVDDFPGIRTTKMILETKGFTTDIVKSGKEALEILETKSYDIVLMDKNINDISGIKTVQILLKSGYKGIIFGFTGDCFSSASESFDCGITGVQDILYKPLDIQHFLTLCLKYT